MSDNIKLIIEIPKEDYEFTKGAETARVFPSEYYVKLILNGIPLDSVKEKILEFLKCPEYETCDWKNCFDCNKSRCINLNNVDRLVSIIEAGKKEERNDE